MNWGAKEMLFSEYLSADFLLDGDLSKPVWAKAVRISFDRDAFCASLAYPSLETMVASRWTQSYLYLAFCCHYVRLHTFKDEDPSAERWQLWRRDVVEAFVRPHAEPTSRYYEFEVAPNNQWIDLVVDLNAEPAPVHDMQWNSGFEHATKIDTIRQEWTVEMRIPMASMDAAHVEEGTEWRVNFYRADGEDGQSGGEQKMLSWMPMPLANASFHQPASFGVLRFVRAEGEVKQGGRV